VHSDPCAAPLRARVVFGGSSGFASAGLEQLVRKLLPLLLMHFFSVRVAVVAAVVCCYCCCVCLAAGWYCCRPAGIVVTSLQQCALVTWTTDRSTFCARRPSAAKLPRSRAQVPLEEVGKATTFGAGETVQWSGGADEGVPRGHRWGGKTSNPRARSEH